MNDIKTVKSNTNKLSCNDSGIDVENSHILDNLLAYDKNQQEQHQMVRPSANSNRAGSRYDKCVCGRDKIRGHKRCSYCVNKANEPGEVVL